MCRAKNPETGEGRLCPSNGGALPADVCDQERERIERERRAAVRDRVARMRYQHEAQRKEIRLWLRRIPTEDREQAIRTRLTSLDTHKRGNAGYRKALHAELRVLARRRGDLAGISEQ